MYWNLILVGLTHTGYDSAMNTEVKLCNDARQNIINEF